ncbi:MAG: 5-bromo-4-chloroindolyl phosphate hydrolysis family protein [Blautia sp.]|nr:5-bromo-4-chloroindolyl phosphate hydrolysis family protein [Blautia sp.]
MSEQNHNQNLDDLLQNLSDIVDKATDTSNYQKLGETINQTINRAMDQAIGSGSDAIRSVFHTQTYESRKHQGYKKAPGEEIPKDILLGKQARQELFGNVNGANVLGILQTVFGALCTAGFSMGLLTALVVSAFMSRHIPAFTSILFILLDALSIVVLTKGVSKVSRISRFRKYVKAIGSKTYCKLENLARSVGKPVRFVQKELKKMIEDGWFVEGHLDQKEENLIITDETYQYYLETEKREQEQREAERKAMAKAGSNSAQVQEVLSKGNAFLEKIRRSNEAIPGAEISAKITKMETIVGKIFDRAQEDPRIIPDLKKLMDYYLPMTVKLLDAYEEMDRQPVQGENIRSSKAEIEITMDTLNLAFEKLLDSVFKDTALDVSSDISVLQTLLAQEGLTEDEFTKLRRKNADGKRESNSQTAAPTIPDEETDEKADRQKTQRLMQSDGTVIELKL